MCALPFAEQAQRLDAPHDAVRILAALFSHAFRVAANVARVMLEMTERRREQLHQPRFLDHELRQGAVQSAACARRITAGDDGPRLSDRVDAAVLALA